MRTVLLLSASLTAVSNQFLSQLPKDVPVVPAWYQTASEHQAQPSYVVGRNSQGIDRQRASIDYQSHPQLGVNRVEEPGVAEASQAAKHNPSLGRQDPNAELLAAIKDVVAKFSASLDEADIEHGIRSMGNQLRNRWQQISTNHLNEQLGRLLEQVADDVKGEAKRKPQ